MNKDKIDEMIKPTRNFWITKCPEVIWDGFVKLALDEYKNDYSMTLKGLLDLRKQQIQIIDLQEKLYDMNSELQAVKEVVRDLMTEKEEPKKKKGTFGGN